MKARRPVACFILNCQAHIAELFFKLIGVPHLAVFTADKLPLLADIDPFLLEVLQIERVQIRAQIVIRGRKRDLFF